MAHRKHDLAALEGAIGHRFADRALLERALTHVSAVGGERIGSYQRLEFLGDRVLGLAICDMLFKTFPGAEEGELSRRLAELVRRETCAEVARDWGVPPYLRLASGGAFPRARQNVSLLADVCEAIVGAVFVDTGYPAARGVIERAYSERMRAPRGPLQDAKTALQEWAHAQGLPNPSYEMLASSGPDHAPVFRIAAVVDGFAPGEGEGPSKRQAEQAAAECFLVREGVRAEQDTTA
ncbi:ribonuclease III [Chelatococcus reniformis]|uniref:Ribonuclease 3 n=1 Tax=Chelatococcus reniformis TaxID=1494448 RepID=A0A916XII6_9HYPH|nr:ribonuclease III [Chelatococcus reniformis]GGC74186.1 ribonuclease 3 [Chelatococcus reniformis]